MQPLPLASRRRDRPLYPAGLWLPSVPTGGDSVNEYFVNRVEVTPDGCWEWTRARTPAGYGFLQIRSRSRVPIGAHRLSYELHVGPIPEGLTVDHLCFNPPCVRPDHLRLLTNSENAKNQRDAYKTHCKRGHEYTPENTRIKTGGNGKRDCKTCHRDRERLARRVREAGRVRSGPLRGESHPCSVLTDEKVLEAVARRESGETISALAREYGVSRTALQGIFSGRTWTHLSYRPKPEDAK